MRYGIFSDIHSNLEAFEVILKYFKKEKIDRYIFLGDIIGYGANPQEVITLLKSLNPLSIAGNHDWAAIDKISIEYFNPYAQEAILWTKKNLSQQDFSYLHTFKITYEAADFVCVHGSLDNPQRFNYIRNVNDAKMNFPFLKRQLCFIGHSHRLEIYYRPVNNSSHQGVAGKSAGIFIPEKNEDCEIKLSEGTKYIVNVGSVGQPRDRNPRAALCIYDCDKNVLIFKRLTYNIEKAAEKILQRGLPSLLARRLYSGW